MKSWTETTLKNCSARIEYGYTASATLEDTGVKLLRITDIVPSNIDWQSVPFCRISERDLEKYALFEGDLVIARTGATVGYAKQIRKNPPRSVFASYLVRITIRADVSRDFVGKLIESDNYKYYISTIAGGAAQPNANAKDLTSFPFYLPPMPAQRRIAAILTAYDDLIEINKRRIALLEKMAEELYREWFVRMRFPGHQDIKFVKGLPESWPLRRFTDLVYMNPKESVHKDDYTPHVAMEDLSESSMHFTSKEDRRGASGSKFRNRDTLLPRITPCLENGKRGFVSCLKNDQVGIGSTEFIVFREKILPAEYIYLLSCNASFRQHAELSMTGASGRQRAQHDCFSYFYVSEPPAGILARFVEITQPLFESVDSYARHNATLIQTRDLLLPRLISGKLSVEDIGIQLPPSMQEGVADRESAHA